MSETTNKPWWLLAGFVTGRVQTLYDRAAAGDSSARGSLAKLRRSVGQDLGSQPDVWADVLNGMPAEILGTGDAPSPWEQAAHDALALFAVHQQSQPRFINEKGVGLGTATRRLANPSDAEQFESPVLRRFTSIVAAQNRATAIHHLRGLIQQLKGEGIGLDYGMLARDLAFLGTKGDRNVRLRWSRELYTRHTKNAADEIDSTDEPTMATASAE